MAAGKYNILIQQGADFAQTITLKDSVLGTPVDLTGATIRGMVRVAYTDAAPQCSFTVENTDLVNGQFTIKIPSATTTTLSFDVGVYDVEVQYASGIVDRVLQGKVVLSPEVTW